MTNNSKKTEFMFVIKSHNTSRELFQGYIKIKHVQKYNYLGRIITGDGICDTEIRRGIVLAKDVFLKINKELRDGEILLETKKSILICSVTKL